jgi:hypothetical protein
MKRILAGVFAMAAAVALGQTPVSADNVFASGGELASMVNSYQLTQRANRAAEDFATTSANVDYAKAAVSEGIGKAKSLGGQINSAAGDLRNAHDWLDSSQLLDRTLDGKYEPDFSPAGAPDTPTSQCGASADCNACFAQALDKLDNQRLNLERLRLLAKATSDYVAKSIALGDGLSGATGLAALQWQHERTGINKEFEKFKNSYDTKYKGMMAGLKNVLMGLDACEASFGERNWYNRFGFIYYQFMEDKYKRNF